MKGASLISAAAIIVIANAVALIHGARNRAGNPDAEITLTQREVRYIDISGSNDDSGVTLSLNWMDQSGFPWLGPYATLPNWLDRQKLQRLGFDCSVNPASSGAQRFYQRQRPRQAFVALEYEGAAWRAWFDSYQRWFAAQRAKSPNLKDYARDYSHLVPVDADLDPVQLRTRHPDRSAVIILPAVVAIRWIGVKNDPKYPVKIDGRIQQLPSSIYVSRPFSDEFRRLSRTGDGSLNYRVRLRYGALFEPWVVGVEFTN